METVGGSNANSLVMTHSRTQTTVPCDGSALYCVPVTKSRGLKDQTIAHLEPPLVMKIKVRIVWIRSVMNNWA